MKSRLRGVSRNFQGANEDESAAVSCATVPVTTAAIVSVSPYSSAFRLLSGACASEAPDRTCVRLPCAVGGWWEAKHGRKLGHLLKIVNLLKLILESDRCSALISLLSAAAYGRWTVYRFKCPHVEGKKLKGASVSWTDCNLQFQFS